MIWLVRWNLSGVIGVCEGYGLGMGRYREDMAWIWGGVRGYGMDIGGYVGGYGARHGEEMTGIGCMDKICGDWEGLGVRATSLFCVYTSHYFTYTPNHSLVYTLYKTLLSANAKPLFFIYIETLFSVFAKSSLYLTWYPSYLIVSNSLPSPFDII